MNKEKTLIQRVTVLKTKIQIKLKELYKKKHQLKNAMPSSVSFLFKSKEWTESLEKIYNRILCLEKRIFIIDKYEMKKMFEIKEETLIQQNEIYKKKYTDLQTKLTPSKKIDNIKHADEQNNPAPLKKINNTKYTDGQTKPISLSKIDNTRHEQNKAVLLKKNDDTKYTDEQMAIIDEICSRCNDGKIIAVNAIAGSGKTRTCRGIVEYYKPKKGMYTAFNKAIVTDSYKKIGNKIECKTLHSLAYLYANQEHLPITDLSIRDIDNILGESALKTTYQKLKFIETVEMFYLSRFLDVKKFITDIICNHDVNNKEYDFYQSIEDYIGIITEAILDKKINPTFSFLLKKFHIMLATEKVHPRFDLFLFDEAQDMCGVMLEIFLLINSNKKVILGDRFQNIYSFMNTVNAFEEIDTNDLKMFRLTKSFRCIPEIASIVESFGRCYLESNFQYKGNECLPKEKYDKNQVAFLFKTNIKLIQHLASFVSNNKPFTLVRSPKIIFEFPLAIYNAGHNQAVSSYKYQYLRDFYNRFSCNSYSMFLKKLIEEKDEADELTQHVAGVMQELDTQKIDIQELKRKVEESKQDFNVLVSTVHTFKGLESDNVVLNHDIIEATQNVDKKIDELIHKNKNKETNELTCKNNNKKDKTKKIPENFRKKLNEKEVEALNINYVALTRSRYKLFK